MLSTRQCWPGHAARSIPTTGPGVSIEKVHMAQLRLGKRHLNKKKKEKWVLSLISPKNSSIFRFNKDVFLLGSWFQTTTCETDCDVPGTTKDLQATQAKATQLSWRKNCYILLLNFAVDFWDENMADWWWCNKKLKIYGCQEKCSKGHPKKDAKKKMKLFVITSHQCDENMGMGPTRLLPRKTDSRSVGFPWLLFETDPLKGKKLWWILKITMFDRKNMYKILQLVDFQYPCLFTDNGSSSSKSHVSKNSPLSTRRAFLAWIFSSGGSVNSTVRPPRSIHNGGLINFVGLANQNHKMLISS